MASPKAVRVAPNSVGWYILEGFPWWPVFVCDQTKLRANLHYLGNGHRTILKKARDFPKHFALVYYFGSHEFSLVPLNKGVVLKPWDCEEKDMFLKGHPKHLAKRKLIMDDLTVAIQETEDFLSQSEDVRLPPYFVPSDLDPTLEPPPPVVEEEEEEDAEGDAEGEQDDDADMEDAEEPEEHETNASDGEGKKKPKKPKEKKEKEKKRKEKGKEKKVKEKKEKKVKEKKEKKGKDKKRKSDSKAKDERPTKAAKVSPKAEKKAEKLEDLDDKAAAHDDQVPKEEQAPKEDAQSPKKNPQPLKGEDETPKKDVPPLEGDALTAELERHIRWILLNCQFEEMTTKMVRKLLEERLGMDLRRHKAQIKQGVARVIESMEDVSGELDEAAGKPEGAADEPSEGKPEVMKSEDVKGEVKNDDEGTKDGKEDVKMESGGAEEDVTEEKEGAKEDVKEEKAEAPKQEEMQEAEMDGDTKPKQEKVLPITERLAAAAICLEASSTTDEQIVEILGSLEPIRSVDREALGKSKLLARLVALQSHSSMAVKDTVTSLARQWGVEAALAHAKEADERRLLELRATLERTDASHDDMCACLDELAQMPVELSHLKETKIGRVVGDLRHHANDRVSSKANALRKAWMKLAAINDGSSTLKAVKKLTRVLEQRGEGEDVAKARLAALDTLLGMSLTTQDIIESKVGVTVSKLRKSSDAKVSKAATKLRKKWKSQVGAT